MRLLKLLAIAAVSLATLTACDPPIPEALLIAEAEKQVACGTGEIPIALEYAYADLSYSWGELAAASCPDFSFLEELDPSLASLVSSAEPIDACEPYARAPIGLDAAAVVFYLDEAFSLNLSPSVIGGIFDGSITQWTDGAIVELNPDIEFSEQPIIVVSEAPPAAILSLQTWISSDSGSESTLSLLTPTTEVDWSSIIFDLEPGSIALVPGSEALVNGVVPANIVLNSDEVVLLDQGSLNAAATQLTFDATDNEVLAAYDPTIEVAPFGGASEAVLPYSAIYPIYINLCGEDNLDTRAAARFMVRLDAQGLMATSTLVALPESLRVASAKVLSVGLPQPEVTDLEG